MKYILSLLLFIAVGMAHAQLIITPQPQQVTVDTTKFFSYNREQITMKNSPYNFVTLGTFDKQLGKEGYRLEVKESGILLVANSNVGLYYGQQTIRQIIAQFSPKPEIVKLPYLTIVDYPQYAYRGLHLDVSRHFYNKEVVMQYLDEMLRNKLNYFHWHLTDDQGWRIEIKRYPKLTEVGAWRTEADGSKHGGYYTQDDIREIVNYARERNITIIPEIEMPGHSSAAVAAYPWLSCKGEAVDVPNTYGIKKDIFCPTDSTFQFLKNVLDEVCDLFPSPYIHIGGDEVPKAQWKQSSAVRALKQKEKLKNYEQVQHYFMHTMESYLATKGKRSIGWGEVTRGGLSDSMIVMSWRGRYAGNKAASKGNSVIMAPRFTCYFDYPQSSKDKKAAWWMTYLPLEKVYKFNPNKKNQPQILGGQANLWTEYITNEAQLWYQLKPRVYALGEALWSGGKDYDAFVKKMEKLQLLNK